MRGFLGTGLNGVFPARELLDEAPTHRHNGFPPTSPQR